MAKHLGLCIGLSIGGRKNMLPFMKKKEGSVSLPEDFMHRSEETDDSVSMLKFIARDLIESCRKGDPDLCESALDALCEHIKEQDEAQDEHLNREF